MENIILPLHILSLLFVAWNVFHADHMGLNWMRGKLSTLDENVIKKYHHGSWIGLIAMIVTGIILFYPRMDYLLTLPQFYIKMGFVAALFVNGFVITVFSKIPTIHTFESLSTKEKLPLLISGAISTT